MEVLYWLRQVVAIALGIVWAVVPLTGFMGNVGAVWGLKALPLMDVCISFFSCSFLGPRAVASGPESLRK